MTTQTAINDPIVAIEEPGYGGYPILYESGAKRKLPRQSAITGIMHKELKYWAAKEERDVMMELVRTALIKGRVTSVGEAIKIADKMLENAVGRGRNGKLKYGFDLPNRAAIDIGNEVHAWAKWQSKMTLKETTEKEPKLSTDAAYRCLDKLIDFTRDTQMVPIAVEFPVIYTGFPMYAGTPDDFGICTGRPTLNDYKSSKKFYCDDKDKRRAEGLLQIELYRRAMLMTPKNLLPNKLVRHLEITGGTKIDLQLIRLPKLEHDGMEVINVAWDSEEMEETRRGVDCLLGLFAWKKGLVRD